MRLRLAKVDEYQFLTCLKSAVWGSKSARFNDWKVGDNFAIIVDKRLAGLAEISGKQFKSKERIWDNSLFPYRIALSFMHVPGPEERPAILGPIRDTFTEAWGTKYGWGILNQRPLDSPQADVIAKAILETQNKLKQYGQDIEGLLELAKLARAAASSKTQKRTKAPVHTAPRIDDYAEDNLPISKRDDTEHTRTQSELVDLGKITGCSVWIAANDQSRKYRGKSISIDCLKKLSNLGLNEEATKQISLIDVIWVAHNAPVCAFEIETSTSVYSGLLRMSDLISVVPALKIRLFIVAPRNRQDKVFRELSRPTFSKSGLSEYCRFISTEDLHDLLDKLKDLQGYVQPAVLDRIAVELEDEIG